MEKIIVEEADQFSHFSRSWSGCDAYRGSNAFADNLQVNNSSLWNRNKGEFRVLDLAWIDSYLSQWFIDTYPNVFFFSALFLLFSFYSSVALPFLNIQLLVGVLLYWWIFVKGINVPNIFEYVFFTDVCNHNQKIKIWYKKKNLLNTPICTRCFDSKLLWLPLLQIAFSCSPAPNLLLTIESICN